MNIIYTYDGSFDGMLTAIFDAFLRHEQPISIQIDGDLQMGLEQNSHCVLTDNAKSKRVEGGVLSKMGEDAWHNICLIFLSCDTEKATVAYHYIHTGMKIGRDILKHLTHKDVLAMDNLCRHVGREASHLRGFARFSEMEGGVFYCKITPKNNVVPLLMPHFADRFCVQPFLVHAPNHQIVGVFNKKSWHLVQTEHLTLPPLSQDEMQYRDMWKAFYDSIAIEERINPALRKGNMPMRFWPNMTEMQTESTIKAL